MSYYNPLPNLRKVPSGTNVIISWMDGVTDEDKKIVCTDLYNQIWWHWKDHEEILSRYDDEIIIDMCSLNMENTWLQGILKDILPKTDGPIIFKMVTAK